MKKVLAIAVLGMISLASCKKDYTCVCKTGNETSVSQESKIENQTRKDAKKACENMSGTALGITRVCKLK